MKNNAQTRRPAPRAFTLVELLIVIAVIAILAGLIIPIAGIAKANAARKRAQAELAQLELAIDAYKGRLGVYPPDNQLNPPNPAQNQLFYELTGSVYTNNPLLTGNWYYRLHGAESIQPSTVSAVFGVGGFLNSAFVANRADYDQLQQAEARDFLPKLEPNKYLAVAVNLKSIAVLGVPMDGPVMLGNPGTGERINPWRYVSSNPTNNTGSYDLWVDMIVSGKTNRISNWSQEPQVVSY